jgi:uncharacterized protein (TIGR02246 family)
LLFEVSLRREDEAGPISLAAQKEKHMSIPVQTNQQPAENALLHAELQDFYARQTHALDSGQAEAWAETFTEDGVFTANAHPRPTVGRAAITEAVRATVAELANDGVVHRHWFGMLAVEPGADGMVRTRFYALVIRTPLGGQPVIHRSTVAEDVLVRRGDRWLVVRRSVTRDDM